MPKSTKKSKKPHMCPWKMATVVVSGIAIVLALSLAASIALNIEYKDVSVKSSKSHRNKTKRYHKTYSCVAEPGETVDVDSCIQSEEE
jgi:hypothetical protein